METYLIYMLKVLALQTLLFGFYWLICHRSTGFQFNRFFLLSILVLPFLIPLFSLPVNLFLTEANQQVPFDPWFFIEQSLPNVVINGSQSLSSGFTWWVFMAVVIYFLVVIPSMVKLVSDYSRIRQLSKDCVRQERSPGGFKLLYVPASILSFSFFDKIFISNLFPLKPHEKNTIITHEEYHLTQRHSVDVTIAEFIRVLCWFNPLILLVQKKLKETHEYLADRHTLKKYGKNEYTSLLMSFKWQEINLLLGNGYSSSSIKTRIKMMDQSNQPTIWAPIVLTFIATLTAFLFACENELDSFENKDKSSQYAFSQADLEKEIQHNVAELENAPQDLIDTYTALQRQHPEHIYVPRVMWISEDQPAELIQEKFKKGIKLGDIEFNVEYFRMCETEETNRFFSEEDISKFKITGGFTIIRKANRLKYMEYTYKMNDTDYSIRDDFDKAAEFRGGMPALVTHLREHLKYPEIAMTKGIEDKLVMRFVVSKHGGLVYLNVEREPSTTDEEVSLEFQKAAYYALKSTEGMWEPAEKDGKYVMSKMTLPIEFNLDE